MRIIFTRIGCTLLTCDMYMSNLRHVHDPVLSSLKMEGIGLFSFYFLFFIFFAVAQYTPSGPWPPHSRGF
jgi:hypothetical protein